MRLITLTLTNFQGVKNAIFNFNGKNVNVYGDNATGKTTIFNAFTWLLFGKASTKEASSFTPKTRTRQGEAHNLEHSAEMEIETYSGCVVSFKKAFKEVYKKKRGSVAEEFSGHTIDYYVNGVPVKEKEYTSSLEEHCGNMEHLKVLTAPDYFPDRMTWQQRRTMLISLFGDVSDNDIIDSKPELRELPSFLRIGTSEQFYSIPDYIKIANAKKKDINSNLEAIPGRIDEANRAIPADTGTLSLDDIKSKFEMAEERKIELLAQKSEYLNNGAVKELKSRLATAELKRDTEYSKYLAKVNSANAEVDKEIELLMRERFQVATEIEGLKFKISELTLHIANLEGHKNHYFAKYEKFRGQQFLDDSRTCPFCRQTLPTEEIEKKKAEFNLAKSKELEKINAAILNIEADIRDRRSKLATANATVTDKEGYLNLVNGKIEIAQNKRRLFPEFTATVEYKDIIAEIEEIKRLLADEENIAGARVSELDLEIKSVTEETNALSDIASKLVLADKQRERIRELEEQEKMLANEYEHIEKGLYLCELFTRTKAAALTDKINAQFGNVKFSLFKEQINGGIAEDCEVMIPTAEGNMVPYKDSNNAAKINAGLEIIDVLSECLELSAPVFIDNAESVTHIINVDPQVIRLVVSEADKVLRLEER